MLKEIIITALSSGALSSWVTWAQARRKNIAEAQANELDNLDKALSYYRNIADDMAKRYQDTFRELDDMRLLLTKFEQQIKQLEDENKTLRNELKNYKTKVSQLERKYNQIKNESKK